MKMLFRLANGPWESSFCQIMKLVKEKQIMIGFEEEASKGKTESINKVKSMTTLQEY